MNSKNNVEDKRTATYQIWQGQLQSQSWLMERKMGQ
jgi:hypothetical protein